MTFLFEVTIPHIAYACLGGFVVFFGMFSLFLREKLYIGEACWAFLFGVIIGPHGAGIFDPRGWAHSDHAVGNTIILEVTRVVLAIGVFAIGVELPKAYMKKHWKSIFFLLGPVMTYGWFVSAGLIYALIPGLNFLSSLTIAACLTPTDPILAAAVVGGKYADKHVPAHLRHLLAAESGCNDGAAFPFLFIGLYLTLDKSTGVAVKDWFLLLWLYQIALGTLIGALLGWGFRHLMKFGERKELIDRQSYVAQYVSLALLTIGICTMLGSDDLLAAFACGTAFAWDGFFNRQTEEAVFSSVIDLLFNVAAFIFIGAWMPFEDFHAPELTITVWRLVVIAILILLLRRLPIILALYRWIPDIKTFREAIFSGHFGPIGVGAIFISTLAAERLPHPHSPPETEAEQLAASIQPIVAFMVLCSILVHGLSIPFFSLGRRVHSVRREWSRRSTMDASGQPEWANQVHRVRPGEHIDINTDTLAERGELPPVDKEKNGGTTRDTSPSEDLTSAEVEKKHLRNAEDGDTLNTPPHAGGSTPPNESQKEENPPDGDEVLNEWKEGHHRIIERRLGPGEEVEVEVQRNAFADEHPSMTSTFRGQADMVQRTMRVHLDKLHEHGNQAAAAGASDASGPTAQRPKSGPPTPDDENDDDAGWQSDRSATDPSASKLVGTVDGASPERKPKKKHGLSIRSRRRSTRRSGIHASPQPNVVQTPAGTPPDTTPDAPAGERGRRSGLASPTTLGSVGRRGPQNAHLDRIRTMESRSRGVSPARSIRWADDQARDTLSPLSSPRDSGIASPKDSAAASPTEEGESARHVVFDLPSPRPKTSS